MSRFTEVLDKVLKEKLVAKTQVGNTTLGFDDKGTLSAKGKIGSTDVSANSNGHAQATGNIAGGTMSTAVNKDGDGGVSFTDKKGRTVSQTAGDKDAWVSAGHGQISKRVMMNSKQENINEDEDESVQYDAHGFATVHRDGVFYLIFNDEVVGEYDTIEDLKAAHEYVINKIKLPEDEQINEEGAVDWELNINGMPWMKYTANTEEEAFAQFWKEMQEEGAEKFIEDMISINRLQTESIDESNDDLNDMLRIAGLK